MKAKEKLPATVKFPKNPKGRKLYVKDGMVSNGHWLFKIDWLMGLKPERSLGFTALKNAITKAVSENIAARLSGGDTISADLIGTYNRFTGEKRVIKTREYLFHSGYVRGDAENLNAAVLAFKVSNTPYLDIGYSACLFFDPDSVVEITGEKSPVCISTPSGEVVGILMGLNPDCIKKELNSKGTI